MAVSAKDALAPLVIGKDHGQLLIESAIHSLYETVPINNVVLCTI